MFFRWFTLYVIFIFIDSTLSVEDCIYCSRNQRVKRQNWMKTHQMYNTKNGDQNYREPQRIIITMNPINYMNLVNQWTGKPIQPQNKNYKSSQDERFHAYTNKTNYITEFPKSRLENMTRNSANTSESILHYAHPIELLLKSTPKPTHKSTPTPSTQNPNENSSTISVCIPSETYVEGEQKCKNELIFNEDFRKLRRNIWNVEHIFAGAPDYEFVIYVDHPETVDIKNNILNIKAVKTEEVFSHQAITKGLDLGSNCTGRGGPPDCALHPEGGFIVPYMVSARLNTKYKFSFKYGKVEIRAKLPAGDWLYPILTLNPSGETYGQFYESGQIKIAFVAGNADCNKILKGGVILGDSDLARNYCMKNLTRDSWSESYHNFQLDWTLDSITTSVDGVAYGKIEPPEGGFVTLANQLKIANADNWSRGKKLAPFDKEVHLQIGLGVGGLNFPDRSDGSKPWKNKERLMVKKFYAAEDEWLPSWDEGVSALKIDYIKVWAL